ncbi:putative late blight resistance protein homolog R1A-3 isoform X2 [Diospyros lotus]|uniref:putative late blight resistance protein homolog R1A-3 isoform X2 n=1 Tax=Diospyros lotus TaxID=55363 RepID=UPI0022579F6C|nr:putative late blight resistance protein homolog R1A-3 isoform X2 [Diospyros lotus]
MANHASCAENLKNMVPDTIQIVEMMLERWKHREGGKDTELLGEFRLLALMEVISRTAFGSNSSEGEGIFEMLKNLTAITSRNDLKIRPHVVRSSQVSHYTLGVERVLSTSFPRKRLDTVMAEIAVNSLMENLKELSNSKMFMILRGKDRIESLYNNLELLRTFLLDQDQKLHEHKELKSLERRIRDVVYATENAIDWIVFDAILKKKSKNMGLISHWIKAKKKMKANRICLIFDDSLNVNYVKEEINAIKREVIEILGKQSYNMRTLDIGNLPKTNIPKWEEEEMVGFVEEVSIILEDLVGERKQLEVISIVGMAGLGKTTLAKRVYNDPLVKYHFSIRGWAYVSQEYNKRDFLLRLLSSFCQDANDICQMSENELAQMLYKCLKGKLYFIVMDDIWDGKVWTDLMNCFPNDNNGSRILFTSRQEDVALHANPRKLPLFLRFLNNNESWDLLQDRAFERKETCPPELMEVGRKIAHKCQGLPLAIIVVAGILASKEKRRDCWNQVGETMNSLIAGDPQLWMKTLSLSYSYLPFHLKPCFLYFGAFSEDFQIPVSRLIWLWVAEGFIHEMEGKSLEDVAEEYLMDLISRSLVLVSIRGFDNAIQACAIHDLVRDFCQRKAKEDCFLMNFSHQHFLSLPYSSKHFLLGARRLIIHHSNFERIFVIPPSLHVRSYPPSLHVRSFMCTQSRVGGELAHVKFLSGRFKLVKVLDMSSIVFYEYPSGIELLLLLKYVAFSFRLVGERTIPDSICDLQNLETLIIHSKWDGNDSIFGREYMLVILPEFTIKMVSLRHLCLTGAASYKIKRLVAPVPFLLKVKRLVAPVPFLLKVKRLVAPVPFLLKDLQTLSLVDPGSCKDFLAMTPHLRNLGFSRDMVRNKCLTFPDIDFLNHLQQLKLYNTGASRFPNELGSMKFPTNLKKLTLEGTYLKWEELLRLSELVPNLESLNLLSGACTGRQWEVNDDVFPNLKFLKFSQLRIIDWIVCDGQFPSLQHLALDECFFLKGVPSEIGNILTLEMIEVRSCNPCVENSVGQIVEEQKCMGKTLVCKIF